MSRRPRGIGRAVDGPPNLDRGFTLSETIIVVFLIAIVAAIAITVYQNSIERARMASCMNELRGIQAALWYDSDGGNAEIDQKTFWKTHYNGTRPGPYVLLLNSGENGGASDSGMGTDPHGDNRPVFVVVGRYEHWAPGEYVFIEDDEPPQFVSARDEDPGYGRQVDWEAGKYWGPGSAGGTAPSGGVGWARSEPSGDGTSAGSSGGGGQPNGSPGGAGTAAGSTTSDGDGRNTSSRIGD